jgi:putative FmdB family regulatory protein
MPIYEYRHTHEIGDTCEETFEIFQKMSDEPLTHCPICDNPVEKILSRVSGGVDKMAPSRLKELGFSKWVKRDKGTYERE